MKKAGLYIHFPFCRRACFYCHFYKTAARPERVEEYLAGLRREMYLRRDPGLAPDSLYVGGGSPSLLEASQAEGILETAAKHFGLAARPEVTLEANPEDLTPARLRGFRRAGFNRLSIGAQSFQEKDLSYLNRTHDAVQAARAVEMARAAGFANVSVDLIIGLPTQTPRSLKENFRVIASLQPSHVSVYLLEGVPSARLRPPRGGVPSAVPRHDDDERDARHYFQARRELLDLGFEHYEVSNFCRPGKASRHNLKYWRMAPYVGLGPSAAGFLDGRDYRNSADLKKFLSALKEGKLPHPGMKALDPFRRRIITGLRLLEGIAASAFASFPGETDFLLGEGLLLRRGGNIAVPPGRILLLNEILGYFI